MGRVWGRPKGEWGDCIKNKSCCYYKCLNIKIKSI